MLPRTSVLTKGLLLGAFSISVIGLTAGSVTTSDPSSQASARGRKPASTTHVSYSAILTFKKGSSEISKTDREQLVAVFDQIKNRGQRTEQAHVAAWSDHVLIGATPKDRHLADARANAIEDLLEHEMSLTSVETYNMSERANYFARGLTLSAGDLKKLFANPGAPQTVSLEDFALVKSKGGVSKAVVIIEIDPASITVE